MWDSSDEQEEGDTKKMAYMWDSMDEEDRADTIDNLKQSDNWVIWKSKDRWSVSLQKEGFYQLLHIQKRVPPEAQNAIIMALQAPIHNFGKDEYVVDMTGHEAQY